MLKQEQQTLELVSSRTQVKKSLFNMPRFLLLSKQIFRLKEAKASVLMLTYTERDQNILWNSFEFYL